MAGSGSSTFTFSLAPTGQRTASYGTAPFPSATSLPPLAMPTSQTLSVGALVYCNDGSITTATPASLTGSGTYTV